LKKLFLAKKIEVFVRYNRDDSINTFQIQWFDDVGWCL
jgi:hypothetical protein